MFDRVCLHCHERDVPKSEAKGSFGTEAVLYIFAVVMLLGFWPIGLFLLAVAILYLKSLEVVIFLQLFV